MKQTEADVFCITATDVVRKMDDGVSDEDDLDALLASK